MLALWKLQNKKNIEKMPASHRQPGNPGQIRFWGLEAIFIINFKKRVAQKLRRIILLHYGLVTFRFRFGKIEKSSLSWFSDLADATMTSQTDYYWLWTQQGISKHTRNSESCLEKYYFGKLSDLGNRKFWKLRVPTNPEDSFSKIWNMGSISINRYEMEIS